jgi:hypothetical protein
MVANNELKISERNLLEPGAKCVVFIQWNEEIFGLAVYTLTFQQRRCIFESVISLGYSDLKLSMVRNAGMHFS